MSDRDKLQEYAYWILGLMDGDTYFISDMMETLEADGFVDENGEAIYEDDEE